MARVAAGSDAHLRIFRMTSAAWRSGFARVFRAPAIVVGMFALTMAAAAGGNRPAQHDRSAPGSQPDGRRGSRGGELRLVAGIHVASLRAGDDVFARPSSALRQRSTT